MQLKTHPGRGEAVVCWQRRQAAFFSACLLGQEVNQLAHHACEFCTSSVCRLTVHLGYECSVKGEALTSELVLGGVMVCGSTWHILGRSAENGTCCPVAGLMLWSCCAHISGPVFLSFAEVNGCCVVGPAVDRISNLITTVWYYLYILLNCNV
jgi:hypothetical protein